MMLFFQRHYAIEDMTFFSFFTHFSYEVQQNISEMINMIAFFKPFVTL